MMVIVATRAHSIDISAVFTNLISCVGIVGLLNLVIIRSAVTSATGVTGKCFFALFVPRRQYRIEGNARLVEERVTSDGDEGGALGALLVVRLSVVLALA